MLAVVGIALFIAFKLVWGYDGSMDIGTPVLAAVPTDLPYTVITPTATVEVLIVTNTVKVDVPYYITEFVTQTIYVEGPTNYVYTEGPERIVEVFVPQPTAISTVPAVMAPGTVSICVNASGVKELYIGGVGIVGGGCSVFQVGAGASNIEVQVNR